MTAGYAGWMLGVGVRDRRDRIDQVHGRNGEPGRILWNIESEDVKADFDRLKAAGATVVRDPYTMDEEPGAVIATFEDPDGNYFQLMSPMQM